MKILIIGAAGMIGSKLANRIIKDNQVNGEAIDQMTLADVIEPTITPSTHNPELNIKNTVADLSAAGSAELLIDEEPDLIFHLAAIVSGEAEANFDKGYLINLDGTRSLLEAIRKRHDQSGYSPKLIFASSIAVFGAPFPELIDDHFFNTPQTSYGTQKAVCELLLADYSRRGILQGIGLRLPTICIRPGAPNKAASGFFSNILREPLNGLPAVLPVDETVKHWFASPRAGIQFLIHAAGLSREAVGLRCNMSLPGLCATVGEQIAALERVAGSDITKLIKVEPDETIRNIVSGWPQAFDTPRAIGLGFQAESNFDEIIQVYLDDESPQ